MQCYYYPTIYLPARWERGMQRPCVNMQLGSYVSRLR